MAQKRITDLTIRTNFDGTVNLPGDDTAQTWRVTGAQILAYILLGLPGTKIDGLSDVVQHTVEGHSTQTSNILDIQKSDGTKLLSVTNTAGTLIRGSTTNSTPAAGFVGEVISSAVASVNFGLTTVYGDLTSILLTAGVWDLSAMMQAINNGNTWTNCLVGISTVTGNFSSGLTAGQTMAAMFLPTSGTDSAGSIAPFRVSLSASTTYYLKFRGAYTGGSTPTANGRIQATRVA